MKTALLLLTTILSGFWATDAQSDGNPGVASLCLCGQSDERHLRELIERLVDDDIGVREKAASDLAEFGKSAIPALEKARGSSDVELRSRAASILRSIAENEIVGRHWHRGARITLDFDRAPVAKVLEELEKQGHDRFKFDAAELQEPMTVRVKDTTFWDALEAVCRAAPALTWEPDGDLLSFKAQRRPPYPSKRQGEFNVWLDAITYSRDYDFTGNPRTTFTLSVTSGWEAGIAPVAVEQKVTEVLDEDGTNLLLPDRFSYGARLDMPKGRTRKDGVYLPVAQGAKAAKRFSRVRGSSTFFFPRAYEEVTLDLRTASAPLTLERLSVAVRNFRSMKDSCVCEVVLTAAMGANDGMIDRLPFSDMAIVDDQGALNRAKTSSRSHSYSGTSYTIHENLSVPFPEGRTPVALKLRVLKDVMEKRVAFEFADIALESPQ
jgi:hypothetical protein